MAWFKFRDDEMVWILGTWHAGWRDKKGNKFFPGNYDVIIDYFYSYVRGGFVETEMNIGLYERQQLHNQLCKGCRITKVSAQ